MRTTPRPFHPLLPGLSGLAWVATLAWPTEALAVWGEPWGTLVWGSASLAVPSFGWLGLGVLALGLLAMAAWTLRKRRPGLGWTLLLVGLAVPFGVTASTITSLNTFTNGEVADANEVNANFTTVGNAVNDNDARITAAQNAADAAAAGHTVNTNTQLTDAQVAAAATAQGFVSGAHTVDTTVNGTCAEGQAITAIAGDGTLTCANVDSPAAAGFGDGCPDELTVADHDTGLLWEMKTGTPVDFASRVLCGTTGCSDPHDVANAYEWSNTGTLPDGGAITNFLAKLNDPFFGAAATSSSETGCLAGYCDWRLPTIVELQKIRDCSGSAPCIDPIFGPTASSSYWSASTDATNPDQAWVASFDNATFSPSVLKANAVFVRAVRAGSCAN